MVWKALALQIDSMFGAVWNELKDYDEDPLPKGEGLSKKEDILWRRFVRGHVQTRQEGTVSHHNFTMDPPTLPAADEYPSVVKYGYVIRVWIKMQKRGNENDETMQHCSATAKIVGDQTFPLVVAEGAAATTLEEELQS